MAGSPGSSIDRVHWAPTTPDPHPPATPHNIAPHEHTSSVGTVGVLPDSTRANSVERLLRQLSTDDRFNGVLSGLRHSLGTGYGGAQARTDDVEACRKRPESERIMNGVASENENPTLGFAESSDASVSVGDRVNRFLMAFLRFKNDDVEGAAALLLDYWEFRTKVLGLGDSKSIPRSTEDALLSSFVALPPGARDREGRPIVLFWSSRVLPGVYGPVDIVRAFWLVLERVLIDEVAQSKGICFIDDAAGSGTDNGDRVMLTLLVRHVQHRIPLRLGAVYVLRPPTVFYVLWPVLKHLIKPKLAQRVTIVRGPSWREQLAAKAGLAGVPREWGGDLVFDERRWVRTELSPLFAGE